MTMRYRYDADDPFGTRPDEKPPEGWDERFWDGVRERIERSSEDERFRRPPSPPRRRAPYVSLAIIAGIAAVLALAMSETLRGRAVRAPETADASLTLVQVNGSAEPAVAVEWARSGGCSSGYVVLNAIDPQVSYVVIDRRLARP